MNLDHEAHARQAAGTGTVQAQKALDGTPSDGRELTGDQHARLQVASIYGDNEQRQEADRRLRESGIRERSSQQKKRQKRRRTDDEHRSIFDD